ncbi:MAG: chain length determinant protein EpsF, partial [Rhodoferax sp.]
IKTLRLDEDPASKASWLKATKGHGDFDAWLASSLLKGLQVRPARESNVIDITYIGRNPEDTAEVANAFAQAYLEVSLSLATEPARQNSDWFNEQTKAARTALELAQTRLSAQQKKDGIVSSDDRIDYETARLGQISTQLTAVQAETMDSQSKRNARGSTVEVMQSPLINSLKGDVARLQARVQELSVNLGPNNPQLQQAQSQLATIKAQLADETGRIAASIDTTYRVNKDREKDLQAALAIQKAKVLKLNEQRDDLNVYRRDVEAAQRAYDAVTQSASQTRLQSLSTQTNVVRLNTATAPLIASSPKLRLNMLIAAFAGTLLGVAYAMLLELMNRRVRSAEDLVQMLDLPVLGAISSNGQPRRLPGARLLMLESGNPA